MAKKVIRGVGAGRWYSRRRIRQRAEQPVQFRRFKALLVTARASGLKLDRLYQSALGSRQTAFHVRRDKAALFQRVQAPPGDRSSRKQPGQAWR
jgi:hypothetical protein